MSKARELIEAAISGGAIEKQLDMFMSKFDAQIVDIAKETKTTVDLVFSEFDEDKETGPKVVAALKKIGKVVHVAKEDGIIHGVTFRVNKEAISSDWYEG